MVNPHHSRLTVMDHSDVGAGSAPPRRLRRPLSRSALHQSRTITRFASRETRGTGRSGCGGRRRAIGAPLAWLGGLAVLGVLSSGPLVGEESRSTVSTVSRTSVAPETPFDAWTRLSYKASKLLVFSGEMTMTRDTSGDKVTVKTESRGKLFGAPFVESWSLSTMDRGTGRPVEFLDVRPGKKAERWSFTERGVEHVTLKPPSAGSREPVANWKVSKKQVVPQGESRAGGTAGEGSAGWVHDYISMIVRLRDLPLRKVGDEAVVRVSTNRGPTPMRIRVSDQRTSRRTLTDLGTGKSRAMNLKELRLRVTPLGGTPSDTRGFLNMEGESELWVEATTRTVTEIAGNIPKVPGRTVIQLAGYRP